MDLKVIIDDFIMSRCPDDLGIENIVKEEECVCEYDMCNKCWGDLASNFNVKDSICITSKDNEKSNVIKPNHYNAGKFDVIEFCLENGIDFCRGNVIKYVVRAGKKDIHKEIEDLNKAKEYIDRIIKHIENKGE